MSINIKYYKDMITEKQLFAFTQFVGDVIGKEFTIAELTNKTVAYFGVCPKEARELLTRCEESEYIERTRRGYKIKTV